MPQRTHKFAAKKTMVDGIVFLSKKEARRYSELKLLEQAGKINDLRLQVPYKIIIETRYVADFVYVDCFDGAEIVEDVKGYKTREYLRKKKLMKAQHGITIRES